MPLSPQSIEARRVAYDELDLIAWEVLVMPPGGDRFQFLLFSETYRREVGVGHEEMAGRDVGEALPSGEAQGVIAHYLRCVQAREPITYSEYRRVGGEWRWWRTTLRPKFNDLGQVVRLVGTSEEILSIEAQLRSALSRDELEVWYQPIHLLQPECCNAIPCLDCIAGWEALIRWTSAGYGPDEFLPVAKVAGLMPEITRKVIFHAAKTLKTLPETPQPQWVSINVSNCDFYQDLELAARIHQIPRQRFQIEITEDTDLDAATLARFERISLLGHPLEIDDFGTARANLAWLRVLDVAAVKIDRQFVTGAHSNPRLANLCKGLISTVQGMNPPLRVICEGIETHEDLAFVRELGADMAQGYLFGRPAPLPL